MSTMELTCLHLALCTQSEILDLGIEALAAQLPRTVRTTRVPAESLDEMAQSHPVDLLIVSVDQWQAMADTAFARTGARPKIAVIGDALHTCQSSLFTSLPADGFLSVEGLTSKQLGDFIERVFAGEVPMPATLSRLLLSGPRPPTAGQRRQPSVLTPREQETLELLVKGLSNKQLARTLGISIHGAKRLVAAVLMKMGAPNRTAAAVAAMQSNII